MRALLLIVATVMLAACATRIDGHEVGDRVCVPQDEARAYRLCDEMAAYARTLLDHEQPGHAEVSAVEIYFDPVRHLAFGDRVYVLLRLGDDTHRLYRVHCGFDPPSDTCFTVGPEPSP
jgi:hypothetical protein